MPPHTPTLARRGLVAALALGLIGAATGVTHALSAEENPRIIGGSVVTENPGGLAALIYEYEKGEQTGLQAELCTASVVAPQWVLTAEHCMDPKIIKNFWRLTVRANSAHAYSGGDRIAVDGWAVPPPRTAGSQSPGADMRLYHLVKPIPNATVLSIGDAEPAVGATTTMIGWGATNASEQAGQDLLKTAQGRVISHSQFDAKGHPAIQTQGVDGSIWKGDSGGPLLFNGAIVGVASTAVPTATTPGEKYGTQKYGNAIKMKSWITSVIGGTAVPTPAPAPEKPSPTPGQPSPTPTPAPSVPTTPATPPAPTLPPAPPTATPTGPWPTPTTAPPAPPVPTVPSSTLPTITAQPTAPQPPSATRPPVPTKPPFPMPTMTTVVPKPTAPRPPSPPAPWPTNPPRPTKPRPTGLPGMPGFPGMPGYLVSPGVPIRVKASWLRPWCSSRERSTDRRSGSGSPATRATAGERPGVVPYPIGWG